MKIIEYLKLIRIKHWIKNILIAIPAFFGASLFESNTIITLIVGFLVFSFYSSAVYVINDICDTENDRKHPVKCKRPLAKGSVSKKEAYVIVAVFVFTAFILSLVASGFDLTVTVPLIYFVINLLYSSSLKNKPVTDIIILVSGFFLRVLYGSFITNTAISGWLYLTIISLSLFLAFGKRRNEKRSSKGDTRKVLKYYNESYLNSNMYMYLTLFAAFYAIWSLGVNNGSVMILTTPLVLVLMLRYTYALETDTHGDPIEMIYHDKVIWIVGAVYAFLVVTIIYFPEVINERIRF